MATKIESALRKHIDNLAYKSSDIVCAVFSRKLMLSATIVFCVLSWIGFPFFTALKYNIVMLVLFGLFAGTKLYDLILVAGNYLLFAFFKCLGFFLGNFLYFAITLLLLCLPLIMSNLSGDEAKESEPKAVIVEKTTSAMDYLKQKAEECYHNIADNRTNEQEPDAHKTSRQKMSIVTLFASLVLSLSAFVVLRVNGKNSATPVSGGLFMILVLLLSVSELLTLGFVFVLLTTITSVGTGLLYGGIYLTIGVFHWFVLREIYASIKNKRNFRDAIGFVFIQVIFIPFAFFNIIGLVSHFALTMYVLYKQFRKETFDCPRLLFIFVLDVMLIATWYVFVPAVMSVVAAVTSFLFSVGLIILGIYILFSAASYSPKPVGNRDGQIYTDEDGYVDGRFDGSTFHGNNCKTYSYNYSQNCWEEI